MKFRLEIVIEETMDIDLDKIIELYNLNEGYTPIDQCILRYIENNFETRYNEIFLVDIKNNLDEIKDRLLISLLEEQLKDRKEP